MKLQLQFHTPNGDKRKKLFLLLKKRKVLIVILTVNLKRKKPIPMSLSLEKLKKNPKLSLTRKELRLEEDSMIGFNMSDSKRR